MTIKKELCKAYSKRIKQLNKKFFTANDTGLVLFVEYLRYLRDLQIVTAPGNIYESEDTKYNIASLITAIAEFDASRSCSEEQRQFHWDNFMELTRQNFMEWIKFNDTV